MLCDTTPWQSKFIALRENCAYTPRPPPILRLHTKFGYLVNDTSASNHKVSYDVTLEILVHNELYGIKKHQDYLSRLVEGMYSSSGIVVNIKLLRQS